MDGPTVKIGNFDGISRVCKIRDGQPALIPSLRKDITARHWDDRSVMRDAVFFVSLGRRNFVIAFKFELSVNDIIHRIRAPIFRVIDTASRTTAAAPFIGEDDFRPVIIKGRGMPISKLCRDNFIDTFRL